MRRTLALLTILGFWAALAHASGGGPAPGLDFGNGIVAPGGKLRYSALSDGRMTVLESVVIGTGRVKGVTYFKGSYGIPLVTFGGETGRPLARTGSASGWAYTLYSRTRKAPFVHALDTVHRRAFCVDLPWQHSGKWIASVRLRVRGGTLELRRGGRAIARMDTKTLAVR